MPKIKVKLELKDWADYRGPLESQELYMEFDSFLKGCEVEAEITLTDEEYEGLKEAVDNLGYNPIFEGKFD